MRRIHLLLICFVYLQVIWAQARPDFMLADSAFHGAFDIDLNNNMHIAYSSNYLVFYQLRDANGQKIAETTPIGYDASPPAVAAGSRNVIVVWSVSTPVFNGYVYGQVISLRGDTVASYIELNDSYGDANRGFPDVTFLNDTTTYIIWIGDGRSGSGIYGQKATDQLKLLGGNRLLSDASPIDPKNPHTIHISYGSISSHSLSPYFVVTWVDNRLGPYYVFARLFNKTSSEPLAPSFLVSDTTDHVSACCSSVAMDSSGTIYFAYSEERVVSEYQSNWDLFFRSFDSLGIPLIEPILLNKDSTTVFGMVPDMAIDKSGRLIIVWVYEASSTYNPMLLGLRMNLMGEKIGDEFKISTRPHRRDQIFPVVRLFDERIYTAWTESTSGNDTLWANIHNFDDPTVIVMAGIAYLPLGYILHQNHPNPFNPVTTIRYELPRSSHVRLSVYDILGREVAVLINTDQGPGILQVQWNASQVPSGVYVVQMVAGDFRQVRKVMVLR